MTTTQTRGTRPDSLATDVDVIVVNYKSAAHLCNCLPSVAHAAQNLSAAVIVVNNGDDTDLAAVADGARVIENGANLGFGAACNIGARAGKAEFILFLNPDATLEADALTTLTAFLRDAAHAGIGIVGPEISDTQGRLTRSCSNIPTFADLLLRATGLHAFLGDRASTPFLPLSAHQSSGFVGQVMGAALMIRRNLFEALGGFDERFFLYYEDVDLSARAATRGARSYYLKSAHARHVGRGSSSRDSGLALALYQRAALTYARLHFGIAAEAVLGLAMVVVELPLRLVQSLVRGGFGRVLRAYGLLARSVITGRPIIPTPRPKPHQP